jgi:serine/threonine protein kinase
MTPSWFVVDWHSCLGGGGEGEVFLGRALETWELCAVKVSVCLDRSSAREQLARELAQCFRASGEGVVGLVAWNLDAARPFLVFEFAHAGTLADEMRAVRARGEVYHPVEALKRIREVLSALAHVHSRGLIHRDVKPANVLRFNAGLKLTDFGNGHWVTGTSPWKSEGFVGTRMYAAPEQLDGSPVDERSDLYAVGCILHEMLTGTLPPAQPRTTRYPSVLVLPDLHELLVCLLAPDKSNRPLDAGDAIRRVDTILGSYAAARRTWTELQLGPSPY